jgi:hypothetical protein
MSWWNKARNRILVVNVGVIVIVISMLVFLGYSTYLPTSLYHIPTWHFFTLITTPIAWSIIIIIALLYSIFQYSYVRFELRHVGTFLPRWIWPLTVVIIIGIVIVVGIVGILTPDTLVVSYAMLGLLGVGIPGLWPAFVIYKRWEQRHNQILIRKGWQLIAAQP